MNERKMIVEDGIVAGNAYDKYGTRNPLARAMVNGFMTSLFSLVRSTGAREVHEVGCGEGHVSLRLAAQGLKVRGSDFSTQVVAEARRNGAAANASIPFQVASIYDLQPAEAGAELIVCCEVLEHLPDPEQALKVLSQLARPHLIVSVPREPIWRALNMARGKYVTQFGNTPGHLNHWSSRSFLKFLRQRFEIVECRKPFPWTMAWCRPKH
ncbi:MAG TPA: methyltransferase domain-containing protein [Candidatus Paceibacterota bacterium]|nr:methyltransferase domain-containing protein [Candidatus Paceibacterota bacterium]